jgi:hypothetical protein
MIRDMLADDDKLPQESIANTDHHHHCGQKVFSHKVLHRPRDHTGLFIWQNNFFQYFPKNQGNSVECGMNTGCVKIYKKPYEFSPMGVFIPPHKRGPDLQLFRGNYSYCLL